MHVTVYHKIKNCFVKKSPLFFYIQKTTGFTPNNIEIYELAFVHKSASVYHGKGFSVNNERLEFLGDSILDSIVADYLFEIYPNENEGFLTNLRSRIVNRQSLNELAVKIGIDNYIKAQGDKSGLSPSMMGNALEAFIGASFIDKGYKVTKKFVITKLITNYTNLKTLCKTDTNYKGQIIDWVQKNKKEIEFISVEEEAYTKSGKIFIAKLLINGKEISSGKAECKKDAEQHASEIALNIINQKKL